MSDKKVKIFNKMYKEFQVNLLKSLKKCNEKIYNVKRYQQIENFNKEIEENKELYNRKDVLLFDKVLLLKRIFFKKPSLNQANLAITWKYIETFYSISSGVSSKIEENPFTDIMKSFGISETQVSGLTEKLMNNESLSKLAKEIASQIPETSENINPQDIVSAMMNPDQENSMGIDFKSIISSTISKIQSGEIDVSAIKDAMNA